MTAASQVRESLIHSLVHSKIFIECYYGLGTILDLEVTAMNKTKSLLSRDIHTNKYVRCR